MDHGSFSKLRYVALFLALVMGGYQPIRVVERGGWKAALGMSEEADLHPVCVEHVRIFPHHHTVRYQHSSIVE